MTVLVGYVPSPQGEAALHAGISEARRRAEPLVVVNTARGDIPADPRLAPEEDLDRVMRILNHSEVVFDLRQVAGDPAEEIVELAADLPASVLVIGIRRRSPVGKLIMGSTAQRVLLDAPCPVLAVKSH
ncbi:universal stress protein [Rhizohabitans arisaemae]|uniref:universal stress protein n=1 Tax=Rhizohabitans arisaemae TaxID=2720610 RepID=UPI0024B0CC71|nr:universal stress protein [Rhizohabitans arisaemae]